MKEIEITRRQFLNYSWRMAVLAVLGPVAAACSPDKNSPVQTAVHFKIPTVDPLDTSSHPDIARFYPALRVLQISEKPTHLETTVPTTIYNFTKNRRFDHNNAKTAFEYYELFAGSNRSINYSFHFQMFDETILLLTKRQIIERSFILVPLDGPSLPYSTDETAVTLYDDSQPTGVKTYSFIKLEDVKNANQVQDPTDYRKFMTEACQSTILVKLRTDISNRLPVYQHLSQEIVCGSLSYALDDRNKNVPYETYKNKFRNMVLYGFPMIILSQNDYLSAPQFGDIIK
jgi:hypothetical protein